jgi:murein DD-endopeptidase MepM/ murein hydrolase activator NlpD
MRWAWSRPGLVLLLLLLVGRTAVAADPPPEGGFSLPVSCRIGSDCWFVNYFDADSGPKAVDFRCQHRTYDGHDGTDIAVYGPRPVLVQASAAGQVVGIRDGEPDDAYDVNPAAVVGKECGNGVRVDHGGGWTTQYCHLRRGSVLVRMGQHVARGAALGSVGQSGMAQFPHVHLSIRRDGVAVDPFSSRPADQCGLAAESLWAPAAKAVYQPFALFAVGFANRLPRGREALGAFPILPKDPEALVLWASVYGPAAGDELSVRLVGPDGRVIAQQKRVFDAAKAYWTQSVGQKRPSEGWPAGTYRAEATMRRPGGEGDIIQSKQTQLDLP